MLLIRKTITFRLLLKMQVDSTYSAYKIEILTMRSKHTGHFGSSVSPSHGRLPPLIQEEKRKHLFQYELLTTSCLEPSNDYSDGRKMFAILNKLLYKLSKCLLLQLSIYNLYIQIDAYKHMKGQKQLTGD